MNIENSFNLSEEGITFFQMFFLEQQELKKKKLSVILKLFSSHFVEFEKFPEMFDKNPFLELEIES